MAITRAQQFRQMLKDGNVAMQGGVKNYLGEQETVSDVPIKWKSGPNKPATELAYITDAEKKLLLKEDIHGSLKDGPNKGPEGIMSLDSAGDTDGPVGGYSGADVSAAETGQTPAGMSATDARGFRAGAISAGAGRRDTDDLATLQEANRIAKASRDRFAKQQNLSFTERANLFNLNKKQKFIDRLINQRKKEILAGLDLANVNPAYDEEDEMFGDLISNVPSIADMKDKFSDKTIDDVLSGNRQIDFFTPTGSPTLDVLGNIFSGPVTKEKLESLNKEIGILQSIDPKNTSTKELMKEFAPNQYRTSYPEEFPDRNGGQQPIIPIVPQQVSEPDEEEKIEETFGPNLRLLASGGMAERAPYEGGIMDLESARQMYGLGKLVKKVTRSVKKIAKSDLGKAAILGAVAFGIPGLGASGGLGGGIFGRASFGGYAPGIFGFGGIGNALTLGKLKATNFLKGSPLYDEFTKQAVTRGPSIFSKFPGGGLGAITAASLLSGFLTKKDEDDEEEKNLGADLPFPVDYYLSGQYAPNPRLMAEGGSTEEKEPVAKKTMPLLDMGGMEKDYREEGGFVPIGRMEKADDVPARLSKNEFVFTADAVRNAGDGDVDLGAEKMYNMMKNLEAGGDVSEESQGMDGARKMFQTSQRLEEVI